MVLKRVVWWSAGAIFLASLATLLAYWTSGNTGNTCNRNTAAQGELMKAIV